MPPITKIWASRLKDDKSITTEDFVQLISEILKFCSSYTNPGTPSPAMHAFYRDLNNPSLLFMITGYQSQDLNSEADTAYAQTYLPRMFEYVQHLWLRQIEGDVREMPLDADKIILTCASAPGETETSGKGSGGWDIWKQTEQGKHGDSTVQGVRKDESSDKKIWVEIRPWGEELTSEDQGRSLVGETFSLQKIMGS